MAKANIYETILENIDADKSAWCKSTWEHKHVNGKISRCLVSHVDLATGVSYRKPGKFGRFVSKSPKKWMRRNRILRHLACEIPVEQLDEQQKNIRSQFSEERDDTNTNYFLAHDYYRGGARIGTSASDVLVGWNDRKGTTKRHVKSLLRKAAKNPEFAKD